MKLDTKGIPINIVDDKIGVIKEDIIFHQNFKLLILNVNENENIVLSNSKIPLINTNRQIYQVSDIHLIKDNDVVLITTSGKIKILYQNNSEQNTLFFTNKCNQNCLMCSQPSTDYNDFDYFFNLNHKMIPLIPKNCKVLGITGGEPTLVGNRFYKIISQLKEELPNTLIHLLTNGKFFKNIGNVIKIKELNENLIFGIPLHSDYYQIHDYVAQSKNSFYDTVQALYNLAKFNQRIEIRIILHKESLSRLYSLSKFIYKNFPFVEHIAFMGLENIGYAHKNIDLLYVGPKDFSMKLQLSVRFLNTMGLNVSIYNIPFCFLPNNLWEFQRNSISDWKKYFFPNCERCIKMKDCSGLFQTNAELERKYINIIN